jgi:hypothetical protein
MASRNAPKHGTGSSGQSKETRRDRADTHSKRHPVDRPHRIALSGDVKVILRELRELVEESTQRELIHTGSLVVTGRVVAVFGPRETHTHRCFQIKHVHASLVPAVVVAHQLESALLGVAERTILCEEGEQARAARAASKPHHCRGSREISSFRTDQPVEHVLHVRSSVDLHISATLTFPASANQAHKSRPCCMDISWTVGGARAHATT